MIFGILDKFWILKIFFEFYFLFFEIEKNLEKVRNLEKVGNVRNFKDFQWVSLVPAFGRFSEHTTGSRIWCL